MNRFRRKMPNADKLRRIDPCEKKHPRHSDVIKYLLQNNSSTERIAESFIGELSPERIQSLVEVYQDEIVSPNRKRLLIRFLQRKTDILKKTVMENKHA